MSAIVAIRHATKAPDFDRKVLLLATQMAHDGGMKRLLLNVLSSLLESISGDSELQSEIEAMILVR